MLHRRKKHDTNPIKNGNKSNKHTAMGNILYHYIFVDQTTTFPTMNEHDIDVRQLCAQENPRLGGLRRTRTEEGSTAVRDPHRRPGGGGEAGYCTHTYQRLRPAWRRWGSGWAPPDSSCRRSSSSFPRRRISCSWLRFGVGGDVDELRGCTPRRTSMRGGYSGEERGETRCIY